MRWKLILSATAVLVGTTGTWNAHATPAEPTGNEYVALAFSPSTGHGGWGTSGTDAGARDIAIAQCEQAGGTDCMIAASNRYGCVADAINHAINQWTGGNGPTPEAAEADALAHIDNGQIMATYCSNPVTAP